MIYKLYFNKNNNELIIGTWNGICRTLKDGEVIKHNDCIYLANNRKDLREKALELKQQWINEYVERIEILENSKVITKYK